MGRGVSMDHNHTDGFVPCSSWGRESSWITTIQLVLYHLHHGEGSRHWASQPYRFFCTFSITGGLDRGPPYENKGSGMGGGEGGEGGPIPHFLAAEEDVCNVMYVYPHNDCNIHRQTPLPPVNTSAYINMNSYQNIFLLISRYFPSYISIFSSWREGAEAENWRYSFPWTFVSSLHVYSTNSAIIMDNMYNNAALSSLCPRAICTCCW